MKPCSKNRQLIAGLALDALDDRQQRDLRAHLETCEACRSYLNDLSAVTTRFAATEVRTDIQTSESFHQNVLGALRGEQRRSRWGTFLAQFSESLMNWRVALPVLGATAAVLAMLALLARRPDAPAPVSTGSQARLAPRMKIDLEPTLSNYQIVANQSLEKLDELLTIQGNRNPSPTRIYTASALSRGNASD